MTESKKLSPFDFVKSINDTKKNLLVGDADNDKYYNSYLINRSLSYFSDTALLANEMNRLHHISVRLQNDFLINIVRKRKRFSKWNKASQTDAIQLIKEYYGYSNEKARQALSLLTDEQIDIIKNKVYKGGREKSR